MPESTPASAGPRVSDEELALWTEAVAPEIHYVHTNGVVGSPMARLILDLADSRTALAAANARIAVLEAERDAEIVVRLQCRSGGSTPGGDWDASLEMRPFIPTLAFTLDVGGSGEPLIDVFDVWEMRLTPVDRHRPLATATQDGPGAAHE
jgi:hypothetical protein